MVMGPHPLPRCVTSPARPLATAVRRGSEGLPLRWRLALGYALMLLLVLAPLAALQASTIHTLLYNDASATLTVAAQAAVTAVRPPPKPAKGAGPASAAATTPSAATLAQRALAQQSLGADVAAVVTDASGRVRGSSTLTGDAVPNASSLVDAARVRQLVAGRADAGHPYQVATARGPYLVALALVPAAGPGSKHGRIAPGLPAGPPTPTTEGQAAGQREVLALARSLTPVATATMYVWTLTVAGTTAALLLATALGALLVRHALRPLTRVAAAADAVAGGDYACRVAVPPARDEVGRLAVAFNAMAVSVEDAVATQRRFVADAAHELRTPLTALGGYADVLLLGAATSPNDLATALEAMRGETRRMARLVNDLLVLARLDDGALPLLPTEVDLAAVLRDAYAGARVLHADRCLTLDSAVPTLPVYGDADRVRQVVANLLDNAVKFSEPGGHIALALCRDRTDALLEVRDDGIGIAPEDLPHVRERFYRADRARSHTTETGGTGLGLAIVQAIVTAHGGSLDIDSRPGRGTTVTVRLPSVDGRIARARTADSVRPA